MPLPRHMARTHRSDEAITVQHFGPRTGEVGGGGIASVIEMHTSGDGRPHRYGRTATMARNRPMHSLDLWAWSMMSLITLRTRHRSLVAHVHLADGGSLRREGSVVILAHLLRIPTVVTVHASELDAVLASDRAALLRVLRRADIVHALGPSEATKLGDALGPRKRVIVIPNAVPMPPLPDTAGSQPPAVLFGGVVGTRKGVDVLLDAWPMVVAACPSAVLTIAGPTDDVTIEPIESVEFLGPTAPSAMSDLLDRSRVAVLPSRREALPMFLIEAMAHARPVVATPVGDIASLVSDEWLVPAADPAALATSIIRLLRDPECATAVGAANRAIIADRFSTDVVHPMFDEVYAALVTR